MTAHVSIPPLVLEREADRAALDALIARAFGPGRFAKAAERLREGNRPRLALSPVAWADEAPIGCARQWPVTIGQVPALQVRALLLGPFAVEKAHRSRGLGAALIRRACDLARRAGHGLILLVGDETYFGPFGFSAAAGRRIVMPGPVDQRRVLVAALSPGAADDLAGAVVADPWAADPGTEGSR